MTGKDKEREERLAAALRENLRRRKAQARESQSEPKKSQAGSLQRGRWVVPLPAVMNKATTGPSASAVCQAPGGLIAYSPGPSSIAAFDAVGQLLVERHVALEAADHLVARGCISQLVQLSSKR